MSRESPEDAAVFADIKPPLRILENQHDLAQVSETMKRSGVPESPELTVQTKLPRAFLLREKFDTLYAFLSEKAGVIGFQKRST